MQDYWLAPRGEISSQPMWWPIPSTLCLSTLTLLLIPHSQTCPTVSLPPFFQQISSHKYCQTGKQNWKSLSNSLKGSNALSKECVTQLKNVDCTVHTVWTLCYSCTYYATTVLSIYSWRPALWPDFTIIVKYFQSCLVLEKQTVRPMVWQGCGGSLLKMKSGDLSPLVIITGQNLWWEGYGTMVNIPL